MAFLFTKLLSSSSLLIPSTLATRTASTKLQYLSPSNFLFTLPVCFIHTSAAMSSATSFYDFKPLDKKGQAYDFSQLKGKVILIVNTASNCGFTPQFAGLEALYKELRAAHPDFQILGFPCNQFASQDPGTDDEIQTFCQVNYGVTFPVLQKVDVNGDKAAPVWEWLKKEKPGFMGLKMIKWNFEKFLVGRDGQVKQRWASRTKPEAIKDAILKELGSKVQKSEL